MLCFQNKVFTHMCIPFCSLHIFIFKSHFKRNMTQNKLESEVIQCSQNNRNYSVELDHFSDQGAGSW